MSLCSKWLRYSVARFWWRLQSSYRPPFLYRLACRGTWGIRGFPWFLYLIDEELNLLHCFLLSHILLDTYTFSPYFRLYFWTCWFLFWVIVFTILSLLLLFIEISFPFFDHFMSAPFSNPFPSPLHTSLLSSGVLFPHALSPSFSLSVSPAFYHISPPPFISFPSNSPFRPLSCPLYPYTLRNKGTVLLQ